MSLNTYPYNPFPASTDKLDEAHNAELQQEVDQLKSGLTNVESNFASLGLLSNIQNISEQSNFTGKYTIIGKICFFAISLTKSVASFNLGYIEGVTPVVNYAVVAYDTNSSKGIYVTNAGGGHGTMIQMSAGVLTEPTAVSGCFLIA